MKLTYSQKELIAQVLTWDRHQQTKPEEILDYRVKLDMIYFLLSNGKVAPIHKATFKQILNQQTRNYTGINK